MKIKRRFFDGFEYVLVCLVSFGLCYVIRVAVSQGIRMAIEKEKSIEKVTIPLQQVENKV